MTKPKHTTGFLRLLVFATAAFLLALALVELAAGSYFINLIEKRIEDQRRREFVDSWEKFFNQRKRIHESKVTGYGWWNELAYALAAGNAHYIQNEALGNDVSLVKDYDVFLAVGPNQTVYFAAIDGRTNIGQPRLPPSWHEKSMEKDFFDRTLAKYKQMRPLYQKNIVNAPHKRSLDKPIVWHEVRNYNGQLRLLTLSPVAQNEGYPYCAGFLLFGYSMSKIIATAEDIIPARIRVHPSKPVKAYALTKLPSSQNGKTYYVSFEPKIMLADSARETLYLLIAVQISLSLLAFVFIAPQFARRYARELEKTIDERTNELALANEALLERQKQLARELQMARIVQQNLLPDREFSQGRLRGNCLYRPVSDLGGDLYDLIILPDGRLGLLIADVSGHGVPAALISMLVKLSFVNHADASQSPSQTLGNMNDELRPLLAHGDHLTAAYAILRSDTGEVHYSVGGHRALIHYQRNAGRAVELDEAQGTLLGSFLDAQLEDSTLQLEVGDRLFVFTDGLVEEKNHAQEMYGTQRLQKAIEASAGLTIAGVREAIMADLTLFKGGAQFADDLTLAIIELMDQPAKMALALSAATTVADQN